MTEQTEKIKVEHVRLYFKDLLADLLVWPPDVGGAYVRLLCKIYADGGAISSAMATLSAVAGFSEIEFTRVWAVLKEKFTISNGQVRQKRCTAELKRAINQLIKQQKAGKKGAKSRWQGHSDPNGDAMASLSQSQGDANGRAMASKEVNSKVTTTVTTVVKRPDLLVATKEFDRVRVRFKELFPVMTQREQNTIGKLIQQCAHLVSTGEMPDALKTLLSIAVRCSEKKKPLRWLVGAANKEGIGFTNGK
jgi:uncharacterized protein YdaU (DUF1376 family)